MIFKVILVIAVVTAINAEYVSYKNYKVYKIIPGSDTEVQILMDIKKQNLYDFWSDIVAVESDVRILVAPEKQADFENYFKSVNIPLKVVIEDVHEQIDAQLRRPLTRSATYDWTYYQSLDEIFAWLDKLAEDYPDVVSLVTIGQSNQNRPLRGVKIDFRKLDNPIIGMIEGGIHAREWISPATVTYIINEFLTSTDPDVRFIADNIVWHIFPVVNPDGYSYTFTNNRMWRKNRNALNYTASCGDISNGIDLNRNFGFEWMSIGASQNPCAETFAGHIEFSEPESRAIANYVNTIKAEGEMIYYFAFHSWSQMVLVPYSHLEGWDVLKAPNYTDMPGKIYKTVIRAVVQYGSECLLIPTDIIKYEIAIRGMDKLHAQHGTNYRVGTSADILYPVSGSSFDWVKGGAEIPIVYLFELRDVGEFGFLLPAAQIIPNNQEIMAGLVEMEKVTRGMGYYRIDRASSGGRVLFSFMLCVLGLFVAM